MREKGFTLVELLAVIVILAIILAITIPGISGIIKSTTKGAFESDAKLVLQQLEYEKLKNNNFDVTIVTETTITDFNLSNANYNSLKVGLVDEKSYIIIVGKNKWDGLKACGTMQNVKVVSSDDTTTCESIPTYTDYVSSKGVNKPKLAPEMTAIKWVGTTEQTVSNPDTDTSWYNYANQEWANAKTVDGSYWVWIPRYVYKITSGYRTGTAGTVNVKFLKDNTNIASDTTPIVVSNDSQNNYVVHPAFDFGGTQITGIWVAKFEMSGTTASLDSKPGVASLRSTSVGSMFTATRDMEINDKYGWDLASVLKSDGTFTTDTNNVDTHMMKNIEWGAIAYLSQSTFGKSTEIWINPSSDFLTGCAGTDVSVGGSSGCTYSYNTADGQKASTTGNIYGIYDISGGSWEYMMANLNNIAGSSGLTPNDIHNKYIDRYTTYDNTQYGDAVYETSSTIAGPPYTNSWYGDYSSMPNTDNPWFLRSGSCNSGSIAGAFYFDGSTGGGTDNRFGFRGVVLVGTGL